jgi:hypothetical protein
MFILQVHLLSWWEVNTLLFQSCRNLFKTLKKLSQKAFDQLFFWKSWTTSGQFKRFLRKKPSWQACHHFSHEIIYSLKRTLW